VKHFSPSIGESAVLNNPPVVAYAIYIQSADDAGGFLHPVDHPGFEHSLAPTLKDAGRFVLREAMSRRTLLLTGVQDQSSCTILAIIE
jgi:hypothetical protein